MSFNSRIYNNFTVNPNGLTVTKKSSVAKLSDEIDYYKRLPPYLQPYFPRFINGTKWDDYYELELEFLPSKNAGDILVFENRPPKFWEKLFAFCWQYIEDYKKFSRPAVQEDLTEMLINKTEREYAALCQQEGFEFLNKWNGNIKTNWGYFSFQELWPAVKDFLLKYTEKTFVLGHFDFHLNNILVLESGEDISFRLVDPRGMFGSSPYGSVYYDLAKLQHSFAYSHIINDKFQLDHVDSNEINFNVSWPRGVALSYHELEKTFEWCNRRLIDLFESLQFIAMAARHAPFEDRQKIMLLTGLRGLYNFLNE